MLVRTHSWVATILLALPLRWSPYLVMAARVGQDVKSFLEVKWRWQR